MTRLHDKRLVQAKFEGSVGAALHLSRYQVLVGALGAALLGAGWLLASGVVGVGIGQDPIVHTVVRGVGAVLILRGVAPLPRLYGYVAFWPMHTRPGNLFSWVAFGAAAVVLVLRPSWMGVDAAFWLNAVLLAGGALSIAGIYAYVRLAAKYVRNTGVDYGLRASAFLDVAMNPRIMEARYLYYYLSTPLALAAAFVSWRVLPLLLWLELNRIQVLVRLMRPPFALFLTAAYPAGEGDMLKLRMACGGQTMMHLVVDEEGRPPRHPRLAEDTFRIQPGAEGVFEAADWRNAVSHLMRACGLVIVETRAVSPALSEELRLIEENDLFHKTLFVDTGIVAPAVGAQLDVWRAQGRHVLERNVESAAALVRALSAATFPSEATPLERIAEPV